LTTPIRQFNPMTPEQVKLVEDNIKLSYFLLNKNKVLQEILGYDELQSSLYFGMCKAAITFNPQYKIKFSTYAMFIMNNEIKMMIRKDTSKYNNMTTSLETATGSDDDGNVITIGDSCVFSVNQFDEEHDDINDYGSLAFIDNIEFTFGEQVVIDILKEHGYLTQVELTKEYNRRLPDRQIGRARMSRIIAKIRFRIDKYQKENGLI